MSNKLKALGLAAVVAVAVMVPLYGDPRNPSVEHGEWARMVVRALDLDRVVTPTTPDPQVFSTLSWKNSLAFRADAYVRSEGVEVVGAAGARRVVATAPAGEVAYPLAVVRGGDYRLRARMAGNPAAPASAEITSFGSKGPAATFTLVPSALTGWVEAAPAHLDPGAYTASILLPTGTSLENVEVAPPCLEPIEPPGGWRRGAITQAEDLAVTVLKAIEGESELPPADSPVEVAASLMSKTAGSAAFAALGASGDGLWLRAGPQGLQANVFVELPDAGLYTVSVFGEAGAGQSWRADACRKAVWCPPSDVAAARAAAGWHGLMTSSFGAGRHFFNVTLGEGASVRRLRAERKKNSPADYVATLQRLGFDVGTGPVSRSRAVDAMHFIERRRMQMTGACGDVLLLANERGLAEPAPIAGPGVGPGFTGRAPAGTPLVLVGQPAPPVVPPVPPVTPSGPPPTLPTTPNPPPGPPRTPSPPPPAPTIPPQLPGSPVLPGSPTPPTP
jgi:hypothetical protein